MSEADIRTVCNYMGYENIGSLKRFVENTNSIGTAPESFLKIINELDKKDEIINKAIEQIEYIRQYFCEDCQADFIQILEILKDKNVIDW